MKYHYDRTAATVPLEKTRQALAQSYQVGKEARHKIGIERLAKQSLSSGLRNVERLIRIPGPPSGALVDALLDVFWSYGVLSED